MSSAAVRREERGISLCFHKNTLKTSFIAFFISVYTAISIMHESLLYLSKGKHTSTAALAPVAFACKCFDELKAG